MKFISIAFELVMMIKKLNTCTGKGKYRLNGPDHAREHSTEVLDVYFDVLNFLSIRNLHRDFVVDRISSTNYTLLSVIRPQRSWHVALAWVRSDRMKLYVHVRGHAIVTRDIQFIFHLSTAICHHR